MHLMARLIALAFLLFALGGVSTPAADAAATANAVLVSFAQAGLSANDLAVIVNDDDPDSVALAAHFQIKRGIPADNMIHVRLPRDRTALTEAEFARIKETVDRAVPSRVQAFALTWARPYRVECMSITSAFAFGFDRDYCASDCKPTKPSPYFNSDTARPFDTHRMRPTMSLAAARLEQSKQLVDRGVASDGTNPPGKAYLVSTSDKARNVRAAGYEKTRSLMQALIPTQIVEADAIRDRHDVLFYFTGLARVPHIESNTFLPGAMADHLTSTGGALFDSGQMSILKWIEAGATGTYGTVAEPCNFPQKFPVPAIAMARYLHGESLIEAYWKSVAMPGQGIFVGEPLARPFAGVRSEFKNGRLKISARAIMPGVYSVQRSDAMVGPFREVGRARIDWGVKDITLDKVQPGYYRFERLRAEHAYLQ